MEIRELYRDEVAGLAQIGTEVLGVRFPSPGELRGLRAGYRFDAPCAAPTLPRLVKPLRSDLPPWAQRAAPSPAPPGVVQ